MSRQGLAVVVLIFAVLNSSEATSTGASTLACNTLRPAHGLINLPQLTSVPAQIAFDSGTQVQSGQLLTLSLRALPDTSFRGFLVQARRNDIDSVPESIVGSFEVTGDDMQILDCANFPTATATHTGPEEKTAVNLSWRAPVVPDGQRLLVTFHFSIVETFPTFWVDRRSVTIIVGQ